MALLKLGWFVDVVADCVTATVTCAELVRVVRALVVAVHVMQAEKTQHSVEHGTSPGTSGL